MIMKQSYNSPKVVKVQIFPKSIIALSFSGGTEPAQVPESDFEDFITMEEVDW